jgi:hypothetical protein
MIAPPAIAIASRITPRINQSISDLPPLVRRRNGLPEPLFPEPLRLEREKRTQVRDKPG